MKKAGRYLMTGLIGKGDIRMKRRICSITTTTVLLALSASAQVSANPGAAQDLVDSTSGVPLVALTDGDTMLLAQANQAQEKEKVRKPQKQAQNAQGYEKSGNPKAAGGPQNPGKGKPQKPSNVKPEQPIAGVKPEQPIEKPKPEQPVAPPQKEPRDKGGKG
jgi:hypothetical protein